MVIIWVSARDFGSIAYAQTSSLNTHADVSGWARSLCSHLKGVKKVCSEIKLCFDYFSYNVSNDINVTGTLLIRNKQRNV